MAAPPRLDAVDLADPKNPYASENKWRHQESTQFARYASPRGADARHGSNELADFLNKSRVEPPGSAGSGAGKSQPIMVAGNIHNGPSGGQTLGTQHDGVASGDAVQGRDAGLEVKCGPLLNYRRMENETWFGSVLIVTKWGSGQAESPVVPELSLRIMGIARNEPNQQEHAANDARPNGAVNGINYQGGQGSAPASQLAPGDTHTSGTYDGTGSREVKISGTKLYSDPSNTFWRFELEVPMQQLEIKCEYSIPGLHFTHGKKTDKQHFFVPAITDSMRIMFHSCNGFSVGTDEEAWSGAALWNDVQRVHAQKPFHVM
jgi:hypothetical protein